MDGQEAALMAITPIDGRYAGKVAELAPIASEFGLIRYRVAVEAGWLSTLGSGILPDVDPLSDRAQDFLGSIPTDFSVEDARAVKEVEKRTNHDVKAVEVWLRDQLADDPELSRLGELIHFGCTSEDITNLAYAMMLREARDKVLVPGIDAIEEDLEEKAALYADIPLLARTHGQPATPTTLGKEMKVFHDRLWRSSLWLGNVAILGKFNGASGNYNAAAIAYPEVHWPTVAGRFVEEKLGFDFNDTTTQIESHDWMAEFFQAVSANNTIMTDLARDMWLYISNGVFKQRVVAGEVGSSTMPHKVNPIDFENAEANLGIANALLGHLAGKLPISRLQRDLSDSSALRATGEAFGHTLVAQKSLKRGLGKVDPNEAKIAEELSGEWAVLTEAVQTVMRRYGVEGAYDIIKAASRGQEFDEDTYTTLVQDLDIPEDAKERLLDLTPAAYTGYAAQIARA